VPRLLEQRCGEETGKRASDNARAQASHAERTS
jgi:hypothetical protein